MRRSLFRYLCFSLVVVLVVASPQASQSTSNSPEVSESSVNDRGPLRVLFLSANTGRGHRASSELAAAQILTHFPGSSYLLLDVWSMDGVFPWSTLVDSYTRMAARPLEWKVFFHVGNIWPMDVLADRMSDWMCGRKYKKTMASFDPDVVVSLHPTMTGGASDRLVQIGKRLGKHVVHIVC